RLYIAGLLLFAAVSLQAQTLDGALMAAENNYYGTARSMALGNAVSALGGDLGSIGINPAGSAVANFSQVTFTPGFTMSRIGTDYTSPEKYTSFNQLNKSYGRFPNVGTSLVFPMGGGNSMSFGFLANATNYFNETISVYGQNASTSQLGFFAQMASGIPHSVFEDGESGYYDLQTAFDAYLIDEINDTDDQYIGATENKYFDDDGNIYVELGDEIGQNYLRKRSGYKTDILFNFGFNIQDQLYLGLNVGLPIMEFTDDFTFRESALRDGYFQTGFRKSEAYEYVSYSGVGAYAKFGAIWRPIGGLRVAATYQTPTSFTIDEEYGWSGVVDASDITGNTRKSADGDFSYNLTTPSIFSLGAAYVIGDFGLVSFDWERTNYAKMYYAPERMDHDYYDGYFADVNTEIRNDAGSSNQYRVGAELRLTPVFTLRGGYAENNRKLSDGKYSTRRSISGGLGLVSNGSFFADLALRWNILPDYFNYPYDLYNDDFTELVYESPIIHANRRSLDAVVTLGWRF
ncbi:MAG: hypothetical protein J6W59_07335, partial [Bacteroidales bacterium]|nr:hypothetical protein [Bacteroidales bacterium]